MELNKILIMFFVGLLLVGFVSAIPPDNNDDGCVSLGEISGYVASWLQGSITLSQVSSGVSWWLQGCVNTAGGTIIVDHTDTDISSIPVSCINKAKNDLHIAFQHTSHGSQISLGMRALAKYNSFYATSETNEPNILHFEDYDYYSPGFDTGGCFDISNCDYTGEGIVPPTRRFLNSADGQDINVIMWMWCTGGHNLTFYFENMQTLILEYEHGSVLHPLPIKFVFMTQHSDGTGINCPPNYACRHNVVIRNFINNQSPDAFCKQHQCILFDFGDMEEYDPDNNYYLDKYVTDSLQYSAGSWGDGGNWGADYLDRHPTSLHANILPFTNGWCAHSDVPYEANLNCVLKGQAAWQLFARMVGWDGTPTDTCTN